jgi:hypothetical protein
MVNPLLIRLPICLPKMVILGSVDVDAPQRAVGVPPIVEIRLDTMGINRTDADLLLVSAPLVRRATPTRLRVRIHRIKDPVGIRLSVEARGGESRVVAPRERAGLHGPTMTDEAGHPASRPQPWRAPTVVPTPIKRFATASSMPPTPP